MLLIRRIQCRFLSYFIFPCYFTIQIFPIHFCLIIISDDLNASKSAPKIFNILHGCFLSSFFLLYRDLTCFIVLYRILSCFTVPCTQHIPLSINKHKFFLIYFVGITVQFIFISLPGLMKSSILALLLLGYAFLSGEYKQTKSTLRQEWMLLTLFKHVPVPC